MYLGRHYFHEMSGHSYYHSSRQMTREKLHVFVSVDGKSTYWTQKGFTNLALRLGEEPSPLYADEFEKFMKSFHGSQVVEITGEPAKPNFSDRYSLRGGSYYVKRPDGYHRVEFNYSYGHHNWYQTGPRHETWQMREAKKPVKLTVDGDFVWPSEKSLGDFADVTKEELDAMEFYCISAKNEQGATCAI